MFIRLFTLALAVVLLVPCANASTPSARSSRDASAPDPELAGRVKTSIERLGVGPDSRVSIRLRDGRKLQGYVSAVDDQSFVVTEKSGAATNVAYPDVTQVKGQNLRTRWKVVIGAAVAAGIIITLVLVRGAFCDGC